MHTKRRWTWLLAIVAVTTLLAAACGDDDGGSGGGATGSVSVSGSSTVEPISTRVAELLEEENPDILVDVDGPGTGDGFQLFCAGETDISDASRAIEADEVALCEDNGIEFIELEVAFDGLSVLTNPANADVTCLSLELGRRPGPRDRARIVHRAARRPARDQRAGPGVRHLRRVHRAGSRGHRRYPVRGGRARARSRRPRVAGGAHP